jgi:hypothetical protein
MTGAADLKLLQSCGTLGQEPRIDQERRIDQAALWNK